MQRPYQMNPVVVIILMLSLASAMASPSPAQTTTLSLPALNTMSPPENNFFSKQVLCDGIPIKTHAVVSNAALYAAYDRISMMLRYQPMVVSNLIRAKVELHIIGK